MDTKGGVNETSEKLARATIAGLREHLASGGKVAREVRRETTGRRKEFTREERAEINAEAHKVEERLAKAAERTAGRTLSGLRTRARSCLPRLTEAQILRHREIRRQRPNIK